MQINIADSSIQNKIIAGVENEIISSYELKNKIMTNIVLNNKTLNQENINKNKKHALKTLINYKLKKNELKKFNFSKTINADAYIKKLAGQYNTSPQGFKEIFLNNNLNYDLYLEEIKTELAWQQLIINLYGKKTDVNKKEIDEELTQLINNQKNIFEYKLSEIELQEENNQELNKLLKEVQNQINEYGFESTAIKYSISSSAMDGGDLGWINSKSLSTRILKIVSKMKLGEVSKPLIQTNSILLIKLKDKKKLDLNTVDLKKIRDKIIMQKKSELLNLFSNSHLSKIRNNAYIEIK